MRGSTENCPTVYARDGWRFSRLPHGAVWMERDGADGIEFDGAMWASIVAGVSVAGPLGYDAALDFHQGVPPPEPPT